MATRHICKQTLSQKHTHTTHYLCCVNVDQFPTLQSKMRVVLRVEVEAVKFLKEEPLRLEALLKRCRSITNTLALLRR